MDFSIDATKWIGKSGYHYQTIDSTNNKAKEMAQAGCPAGTLITAETQEAGIGRRGRSWSSEEGQGLYMSVVLRPKLEPDRAPMLTLVTAMAVSEAIYSITHDSGIYPFIKWPNDIVIRGRKVCGILTEMSVTDGAIDHIVIGIGVNVHNRSFPEEIAKTATSIELETGCEVARERLGELIWIGFEKYYEKFLETEDLSMLQETYQQMSANKGRKVIVHDPMGEFEGTARGITELGELIVEAADGLHLVSGGEVSVRGIYGYV